jgi:type IV pilus assembly protein PilB
MIFSKGPFAKMEATMPNPTSPLILCVDDDKVILDLFELLLTGNGYKVITAESGNQALRAIQNVKPDLILLDVTMPEMDGYEVCSRLQQNKDLAYIPVIFATAREEEKDRAKAFTLGAVDYLVKPTPPDVLLQKVASHLNTKARWQELRQDLRPRRSEIHPSHFPQFKAFLAKRIPPTPKTREVLAALTPPQMYALSSELQLTPAEMAQHLAEFLHLSYLPLFRPEEVVLGVLPSPFCKTNLVVSIKEGATDHAFVLSNPFNWELVQLLKKWKGQTHPPKLFVTEPQNIIALFEEKEAHSQEVLRKTSMSDIEEQLRKRYQSEAEATQGVDESAAESEPIILLANQLIEDAYSMRASDIHIEPWENEVIIRYRVDGVLREINRLRPQSLIRPLVSRIKIMSALDIVERRLPQDGRVAFKKFSSKGLDFDLRVAISPMNFGEKVVMRILDKHRAIVPLSDLGFSPRNLQLYREKITTPYGMILHVGPTGSGKSTTLYSALKEIQTSDINIQTIEDPIEYTLPGINQMQVHREIGLTFQRALRSYLRQDPDVILVGEIRDRETAEIAIEAAITGHLLLSTLHTNDAPSTVARLIEMGIEPFMVSASIVLVCAQRLLRRLCGECKEAYQPTAEEKQLVGVAPQADIVLYRPRGCRACNNIGYKGRIGTHEVMALNDAMQRIINTKGVTAETIKHLAVEDGGMTTLYWDAMEKVRAGLCSLADSLAEVRKDEFDTRPAWMSENGG